MRSVLACTLILSAGIAYAADPPAEAQARAALALAKAKATVPAVVAAPAPRPVVMTYPEAKRVSLARGVPVVVFVGCDPVPSRDRLYLMVYAETLGDYKPGTVLVCYPSGEELWADTQISCPAPAGEIEKAVRAAGKKVEARPAGKRLDWS